MPLTWFRQRGYRHFDVRVNVTFAQKAEDPDFVSRHPFSPLLHYTKKEKRYKKCTKTGMHKIATKNRPIMYASHRDACIFSLYSYLLNKLLTAHYEKARIGENVIAYRELGRSNYDFAAEAFAFAQGNVPATILAFDISSFFDNLDHSFLKERLREILGVRELPEDWYRVFRAITRFCYVDLEELKQHSTLGRRFTGESKGPIASIAELKSAGIRFCPNPGLSDDRGRGIPQGTPISASASNLYMIRFDARAREYCDSVGALYRRYSDDILIICRPECADEMRAKISELITAERLEIQPEKTEQHGFGVSESLPASSRAAQYLGFTFYKLGPAIRQATLARQHRKMRNAFRKTKKIATRNMEQGLSNSVYTKRLRRRFTNLLVYDGKVTRSVRNFSSYARRSAQAFGPGEKITGQVRKFERAVEKELKELKSLENRISR